ncbi:MAG TPA: MipA/OmpV family protein [Gammaproteobacteria bacterium]|nr:MipA/OmpV family protein [Gammaproteobacteria bacterium]
MGNLRKTALSSALAAVVCLAAGPVLAEGGFIGLGATYSPDYEGGDDYEASPVAFGRYNLDEGRYLAIVGNADAARAGALVFNMLSGSSWEMGPALGVRYERNSPHDDRVKRMNDIDFAYEAGGFVKYKSGSFFTTLSLMFDISDTYGGYIGSLEAGYRQKMSDDFGITYSVSTSYADEEYMQEYFGVDYRDANSSGLPHYKASSGIKDYGLGIGFDYRFSNTWGLLAKVDYYRMTGDAEDSPIVSDRGDKNQFKSALALTYSF